MNRKKTLFLFILGQLSCTMAAVTSLDITNNTSDQQKILLVGEYGILTRAHSSDTHTMNNGFKVTLPESKQASSAKVTNPNDKDVVVFLPAHQAVSLTPNETQSLPLGIFLRLTSLDYVDAFKTGVQFVDFYQDRTSIKARFGVTLDDIQSRLSGISTLQPIPEDFSVVKANVTVRDRGQNIVAIYKRLGSIQFNDLDSLQRTIPAPMTLRFRDKDVVITDAPNMTFVKNGVTYQGLSTLIASYSGGRQGVEISSLLTPSTVLYQKASFSSNADTLSALRLSDVLRCDVNAPNTNTLNLYADNATGLRLNGVNVFNGDLLTLPAITTDFLLNIQVYTGLLNLDVRNASYLNLYADNATGLILNGVNVFNGDLLTLPAIREFALNIQAYRGALNLDVRNASYLNLYADNATGLILNGVNVFNGERLNLPNVTGLFRLVNYVYTGVLDIAAPNASTFRLTANNATGLRLNGVNVFNGDLLTLPAITTDFLLNIQVYTGLLNLDATNASYLRLFANNATGLRLNGVNVFDGDPLTLPAIREFALNIQAYRGVLNLDVRNASFLQLYANNATGLRLNGVNVFDGEELVLPQITELNLGIQSYTGIVRARFDNATSFTDIYAHNASEVHINTRAITDATAYTIETNVNTANPDYPLPIGVKRFVYPDSHTWLEVKTGALLVVNGTTINTN